ncbi:adenyl-nucleotide exchange factor sse1 [Apophysomyces sp. BC1034]|nr:adenyl-nucleotide exchange factor sse1 [Apophysomyces sp. BC1015]KAG0177183.1 adenyl-nucleotide exchange factor sse1 [Apophysomyces sp. BC1021]KAG0187470.1 adenyl-nucleotide exchange factor sse1 [Apophysomyces sp. BC1034]
MSVVGFDVGNLQAVISVARNRGIDVICNEVSNRATPSMVSFGLKQRFLGEAAKTQEISNFKNTVGSLKRLAGRTANDADILEIESSFLMSEVVDVQGQAGVKVNYLGEAQTFSNVQLIAMYLGKLKEITANEIKGPVSDCVITVPGWFTEIQRRAVLDAAEIAGLNCLRLVNDLTAAALGYGITKTDLPEEKARNVVFVDVGHSSYSASIASFVKGSLTVRGTAYDQHFGGREFDKVIVDKLAAEFKEKYKIDVFSNKKALLRLRVAAERCKKVLSANPQAPVNIESIMDDRDVSTIVDRKDFEEWAAHLFTRTETTLQKVLEKAGMTVEDIDAIEIVGGTSRIPAIKTTISNFFGKEISTTLNQDEAVSRGAALQCAMLSPVFKVRDFRVNDICTYPIKLQWAPTPEEEETEIVVFDNNNSIPSTKVLTFFRREPFKLEAVYAHPEQLPRGINPWIGQFDIKNVEPVNGEPVQIKVKVRLNIHGIMSVESAYTVEEKTVEEEVTNKEGEKEVKKTKKLVKKADLPVISGNTSISRELINQYIEKESQMAANDKLIAATEAAKNSLEEYGYDMRDKIIGPYADYIDPSVKDKFAADLNEVVDWIYDEGDDAPKSVYVEKLEALKKVGNPVVERYREAEERPRAERTLRATIERLIAEAMSGDEKYSHIPAHEKQDIADRCDRARRWLDEQLAKQANVAKHETPVLFARDIVKEDEAVVFFANPILNKPKPAPKPEATEPEAAPAAGADTPMEEQHAEKKDDMDID